jgi:hypothetical protein
MGTGTAENQLGLDCGEVNTAKEWRELAQVLDRLCFWLLFTLMTVSAFGILLYPKYTGNESGWYPSAGTTAGEGDVVPSDDTVQGKRR